MKKDLARERREKRGWAKDVFGSKKKKKCERTTRCIDVCFAHAIQPFNDKETRSVKSHFDAELQ